MSRYGVAKISNETKQQLKSILEHNHQGRPNAITRRELRRILNYDNDRHLRLMIVELIDEGMPILSATDPPAGYYLPANRVELMTGLETLKSYIIDLCIRRVRIKKHGTLSLLPAEQGKLL